jgi:hypothetical protein
VPAHDTGSRRIGIRAAETEVVFDLDTDDAVALLLILRHRIEGHVRGSTGCVPAEIGLRSISFFGQCSSCAGLGLVDPGPDQPCRIDYLGGSSSSKTS